MFAFETLKNRLPPPGKKWSVFVKVDCGNKRGIVSEYNLHYN